MGRRWETGAGQRRDQGLVAVAMAILAGVALATGLRRWWLPPGPCLLAVAGGACVILLLPGWLLAMWWERSKAWDGDGREIQWLDGLWLGRAWRVAAWLTAVCGLTGLFLLTLLPPATSARQKQVEEDKRYLKDHLASLDDETLRERGKRIARTAANENHRFTGSDGRPRVVFPMRPRTPKSSPGPAGSPDNGDGGEFDPGGGEGQPSDGMGFRIKVPTEQKEVTIYQTGSGSHGGGGHSLFDAVAGLLGFGSKTEYEDVVLKSIETVTQGKVVEVKDLAEELSSMDILRSPEAIRKWEELHNEAIEEARKENLLTDSGAKDSVRNVHQAALEARGELTADSSKQKGVAADLAKDWREHRADFPTPAADYLRELRSHANAAFENEVEAALWLEFKKTGEANRAEIDRYTDFVDGWTRALQKAHEEPAASPGGGSPHP